MNRHYHGHPAVYRANRERARRIPRIYDLPLWAQIGIIWAACALVGWLL